MHLLLHAVSKCILPIVGSVPTYNAHTQATLHLSSTIVYVLGISAVLTASEGSDFCDGTVEVHSYVD